MALVTISEWFWNDWFWLPHNVTWKDLKSTPHNLYTSTEDLYLAAYVCFCFLAFRDLVSRHMLSPLGFRLGVKPTTPIFIPNIAILEQLYKSKYRTKHEMEKTISTLKWSEREVERWLRKRKAQNKSTPIKKFSESSFKFFYYFISFTYGIVVLWPKEWFWNLLLCWKDIPQPVETDVKYYYLLSLGFYTSQLFSHFADTRRKDFVEMLVHHFIAVNLLFFSWICSYYRIACVILLVHDFADIFLEAAKCAKYCHYQRTCDMLFICFTIAWFLTRLGLYPLWVLSNTLTCCQPYPAFFFFNCLLLILQLLHCIWSYYLLQLLWKSIVSGQTADDTRSSSEEESSSSNIHEKQT